MGCSSCGTTGKSAGCQSNGTCGTSGCNKLNVYDWLTHIAPPEGYKPFTIVEIAFKGGRKEYFNNSKNLELYTGDYVVVDSENGYGIGTVSMKGELVKLQLKKNRLDSNQISSHIQRVALERDMEKYKQLKDREAPTLERARTIAIELKLDMKLSDIEFQADSKKVTFFYTAENRVDFRELIKRYADEFRTRIEMRQIGYREEAGRLGGIGSCGRVLCCTTWLSDFKIVSTSAAKQQNLSINMLKLSGQCGRLKCCLNYELDIYVEALSEFPKAKNLVLQTERGPAFMQKVDILKRLIWFQVEGNTNWIPLDTKKVNAYVKLNQKGEKAPALTMEMSDSPKSEDRNQRQKDYLNKSDDLLSEDIKSLDNKVKSGAPAPSRNKNKKRKKKPFKKTPPPNNPN